tara:strand:- start:744 stop:938 length:195 start_codon:yes stop_codon:yes gene_type:complete
MKLSDVPPYILMKPTKEVIFYIPKKFDSIEKIPLWLKKLNLPGYKGMIINSKCTFNRLKDQDCK